MSSATAEMQNPGSDAGVFLFGLSPRLAAFKASVIPWPPPLHSALRAATLR